MSDQILKIFETSIDKFLRKIEGVNVHTLTDYCKEHKIYAKKLMHILIRKIINVIMNNNIFFA